VPAPRGTPPLAGLSSRRRGRPLASFGARACAAPRAPSPGTRHRTRRAEGRARPARGTSSNGPRGPPGGTPSGGSRPCARAPPRAPRARAARWRGARPPARRGRTRSSRRTRAPAGCLLEGLLTTLLWLRDLIFPTPGAAPGWFTLSVSLWLWFTVVFANFAETIAEGRGKAQANTLRKMRREVTAGGGAAEDAERDRAPHPAGPWSTSSATRTSRRSAS
jgi:hypothetical protein